MKIGIFTDSYKPYISGVTTSIEMLKKGLEELGHEVYIICLKNNEKLNNYVDDKNVIRINGMPLLKRELRDFRLSFFNYIKVIKLRKYDFDVIHIHTEFSIGLLGLYYAKKSKVPIVYTIHTLWEDYFEYISKFLAKHAKRQMLWGLKKLLSSYTLKADYTIVPTNKMFLKMQSYGVAGNYSIIPTGIDIKKFLPLNVDSEKISYLREKLNINNDDFCYLYLGRLSAEKSIDIILESFLKLNIKNTKLIIVGDGNELEKLKNIAEKSDTKNIIFVGKVDWNEVCYYYRLSDCFLNASTSETQGLTYIEAMASGLAVILRKDSVLDNVIDNNVNGLLFDNTDELIEKMKLVYMDKSYRKLLGENALKSVENFSKECYTNSVLNLYEDLVRKRCKATVMKR